MGGWSGWSVSLLFASNINRFSHDEAHFIKQHFVLIIVLPGFKVQWVLLNTPTNLYILNKKPIHLSRHCQILLLYRHDCRFAHVISNIISTWPYQIFILLRYAFFKYKSNVVCFNLTQTLK